MTLLPKIERYLKQTNTPPTRFGRAVANDPRLVFDLRNGREAGPRLVTRVSDYLESKVR